MVIFLFRAHYFYVSIDFDKFIISCNLKYHSVISDIKAVYFPIYAEVFHRVSQPKLCTQIYFCPRVLHVSPVPSLVIQFPFWVDRTHNPQEINFRLPSPKNAKIDFKIFSVLALAGTDLTGICTVYLRYKFHIPRCNQ
jgi:hypothetical protein